MHAMALYFFISKLLKSKWPCDNRQQIRDNSLRKKSSTLKCNSETARLGSYWYSLPLTHLAFQNTIFHELVGHYFSKDKTRSSLLKQTFLWGSSLITKYDVLAIIDKFAMLDINGFRIMVRKKDNGCECDNRLQFRYWGKIILNATDRCLCIFIYKWKSGKIF